MEIKYKMLNRSQLNESPSSRVFVFKCLIGSSNYNLSTESSDKDYKVFVLPNMEDLYYCHELSTSTVKENGNDYDYKDIRILYSLLAKGSPQYIEILFSKEVIINQDLQQNNIYHQLKDIAEDLVKVCNMELLTATFGHIVKKLNGVKIKDEDKLPNGKIFNIESQLFDLKQLHHAYRLMLSLKRYYKNNFYCYLDAICFHDKDPDRELLIKIKTGNVTLKQINEYIDTINKFVNDKQRFINDWKNKFSEKYGDIKEKYIVENKVHKQFSYNKPLFDIIKNGFNNMLAQGVD